MKLGDLATIRSGLVLSRKQEKNFPEYQYPLLNLRSIHPKGFIEMDKLDVFQTKNKLHPDYLAQSGDIIIRLSIPYTAVLIDDSTKGFVISSNFGIIRTNPEKILPDYLVWLLNTEKITRLIYNNTSGNMLSAIHPGFFSSLEIDIPDLEDQNRIAEIYSLSKRELSLIQKLADEKEKYYAAVLNQLQNNIGKDL